MLFFFKGYDMRAFIVISNCYSLQCFLFTILGYILFSFILHSRSLTRKLRYAMSQVQVDCVISGRMCASAPHILGKCLLSLVTTVTDYSQCLLQTQETPLLSQWTLLVLERISGTVLSMLKSGQLLPYNRALHQPQMYMTRCDLILSLRLYLLYTIVICSKAFAV